MKFTPHLTMVGSKTTYESNNDSQQVTTSHNESKLSHNESQRVKVALQQVATSQNCITTRHNKSKLHYKKSQRVKND